MKKLAFLIFIINYLVVFFIFSTVSLTNNTLKNNGRWESGKLNLEMGVMGAENFFTQTQPLNGNKLNLGSWHGFQEIFTKEQYSFDKAEFDAKLSENGYFIGVFKVGENADFGFEVGSDTEKNNCLVLNKNGKFEQKTNANLAIKSNHWHHFTVLKMDHHLSVTVDGQTFSCSLTVDNIDTPTSIKFKSGLHDVLLDNITLSKNNKIVFNDDFSNHRSNSIQFYFCLSLFIGINFFLLYKIWSKDNKKNKLFLLLMVNFSILLSVLTVFLYLMFFFVGNYPNLNFIFGKLKHRESEWVDNEVKQLSEKVMNKYVDNNQKKYMFIGSSQTWGAGASTAGKSFPVLFEKELNKKIAETTISAESSSSSILGINTESEIKVVNAGISGTTSNELLSEYENNWLKLKPEVVFINLSSNDFSYKVDQEVFKTNIEKFIKLNQANNIKTILLIEASSAELIQNNVLQETLRDIAQEQQILIIDMNNYLNSQDDSGQIWWDFIHPTDYGHELIAKYLLEKVWPTN